MVLGYRKPTTLSAEPSEFKNPHNWTLTLKGDGRLMSSRVDGRRKKVKKKSEK